jgi:hypothetical protein
MVHGPLQRVVRPHHYSIGKSRWEYCSKCCELPKRSRQIATARSLFDRKRVRAGPSAKNSSMLNCRMAKWRADFESRDQRVACDKFRGSWNFGRGLGYLR